MKWVNKIHLGDSRAVLARMIRAGVKVDMCITSPPYWALRNYDTDPQIWDGDPHCEHEWGEYIRKGNEEASKRHNPKLAIKGRPNFQIVETKHHAVCTKCGAWRGSLGLEPDFNLYIKHLADIFDLVKEVLSDHGTLWVNLGDTYYTKSGNAFAKDQLCSRENVERKGMAVANLLRDRGQLPTKCLCEIPARFALEMIDNRGWTLRNEIIWYKPNAFPSSVRDRFTIDFEKIFFFTKQRKYFFDQQHEPVKCTADHVRTYGGTKASGYGRDVYSGREYIPTEHETRNKRTVWAISTVGIGDAHFAAYPEQLLTTPIKAGCPLYVCTKCGKPRLRKDEKCGCEAKLRVGIVLDVFMGSGTTAIAARRLGRNYIGIELNAEYRKIAIKRLERTGLRNMGRIESYFKEGVTNELV